MKRSGLIIAALVIPNLAGIAMADGLNDPTQPQKGRKLSVLLNSLGANNKDVMQFVDDMRSHAKEGHINFAERNMMGGKVALRYTLDDEVNSRMGIRKQVELSYTPKDSHFEAVAGPHQIMIGYHYKFH